MWQRRHGRRFEAERGRVDWPVKKVLFVIQLVVDSLGDNSGSVAGWGWVSL